MVSLIGASPERIVELRTKLGLTQSQLAERLGVTYVTVSRWETGQRKPNRLAQKALLALARTITEPYSPSAAHAGDGHGQYVSPPTPAIVDFRSDPELVRLFVEGQRLRYGHLFSPIFGSETALIDPLPHQVIAVYQRMLLQPRLRFLLADDAGAGKTIMSGLYIREMLSRRLIKRVLIVPPAGLVGNWKSEMQKLFSLHFREVTGPDCQSQNPFGGLGSDLVIISVDTLAGDRAFARLAESATTPYDLVIFDEAHKLSAGRNADLTYETTERYRLAELLAGADPWQETRPPRHLNWHPHHLLLLTATPHMGKDFPYYALWRLLEPGPLRTVDAFNRFPQDERAQHFLRRSKEEMLYYDGSHIYPTRESDTASYDLTTLEWQLYEAMTSYVRDHYNKASFLNRSAARLAMSVLQRRAASSARSLLRSLERRQERLERYISLFASRQMDEERLQEQQQKLRVTDVENEKTSDEEAASDGQEERETSDAEAMDATASSNLAELEAEQTQVEQLISLARTVYDTGEEAKFERLRQVIEDPRFKQEKLLIFTEYRDTMDFLVQQLERMGYTGQVARIHGGMPYPERQSQMDDFKKHCRFMVATDAAGEGINLQFCWIMVNYDIPWNPARIEQRFGRIHRYKQTHDPVMLVNLVANKTREGQVLSTLLTKLELIRKEMGSDKVFDIIGRLFQSVSLSEIIMRAVVEDRAEEGSAQINGVLTPGQSRAILEADARLRGTGGDVASQLPGLVAQRDRDLLQRLLPGYVRRFIEKSAPKMGIAVRGDLDKHFKLEHLPSTLGLALEEATDSHPVPLTVNKPAPDEEVLFLRPGEYFFDRYRIYFCEREAEAARRGAVFTDPYAREPYLYHLAEVCVIRRADPDDPELLLEQTVETKLVALRQPLGGQPVQCPVEHLMVLRPLLRVPPEAWPSHSQTEETLVQAAAYTRTAIAEPLAAEHRSRLAASIPSREAFLRTGFDFQEGDLLELHIKLRAQAEVGDAVARRRLDQIREKQTELKAREDRALGSLRREPELVQPGEITFLAHALVLPSTDPDDKERYDAEIERIAMDSARAYEESQGGHVQDVSTPALAFASGLDKSPGFDLLSRRPEGERRCIEVKGRRAVGDVELTENEWAKAANLREQYWLYVVYDCTAAYPRLMRIKDPFAKILVRAKGGVIIDVDTILRARESD